MSDSPQPAPGYKLCPQCRQIYPASVETCPRDQLHLIVEERIIAGKYILEKRIGKSSHSEVYLAEQPQLGRMVAIKLLQRDPEVVLHFTSEIRALANLKHEHVVTIHDSGYAEDGRPFIAMEYLEGEDLAEHLERAGPIALERALLLWRQAVSAVAAAHRRNIVHGDIKPKNLFLTHKESAEGPEEIVKIIDFRIAKQPAPSEPTVPTPRSGSSTASFAALEQLQSGEEATPRSDVYALGLVLLEMLAGKLPWQVALRGEGDVGETLLRDFAQAQKQKETEKGRTVPDEILSLIGDVLSRDPARRPADAGELLELVRRLPKPGLSAAAPSEKNSTAASAGGRSKLERRAAEPTPPAAAPPAAAESSSPGTHSVSGTETPPMGVEVLTELLKKIKEQEPHVAAPPPAPPSRSSLRVMLAVFALFAALGLLGVGGLLFLRTRGAGTLPPALVALLRQPKPAPPGDSGPAPPSPAPASRPADLSPGARTAVSQTMAAPPPPDLAQSPPRTADLGVAADAGTEHKGAPGAEDPKAIKLRFVYGEEDGVDSIDCTDEAEVLKRGEDKHGTFVEVLLKPGGSCRASGPGGGKNYKYETLSQKHIDNAGFRRVHVRLSQSGQEEAATAAKPTTDGKPASPLPPPPSPDKDKAKEKEGGGS